MISTCVLYTAVMGDKASPQYNVIKILLKIKRLPPARCEFILSLTAVTAKREREVLQCFHPAIQKVVSSYL